MIKVADMLASRERANGGNASEADRPDDVANGAVSNSPTPAGTEAKRAPEIILSNGRYYVARSEK